MEKPARIIANEKMRTFNEGVRKNLQFSLNFMLGSDSTIEIGNFEPFLMPIESYIAAYKKQSILIKIFSEKSYVGELYWFFELNTAIILGSIMRMMPQSSLDDKLVKKNFDSSDQDSFGEVGNQLCGVLDRAFRTLTNKNIHLRMDFNKKVYPEEAITADTFKNHEEYVVLLSKITIPNYEPQKITLLLPRTLYEVLLNIEIQLEGIDPKIVLVYSKEEALVEKIQSSLNNRYVKVLVAKDPSEIIDLIGTPNIMAIGIDLDNINTPIPLQDSIYLKRLLSNYNLVRLPYFLTCANMNPNLHAEIVKMGLKGASQDLFRDGFLTWVKSFLKDSEKKANY